MNRITTYTSLIVLIALVLSCKSNENENKSKPKEVYQKEATQTNTVVKTIVFFGNSLTAGYGLDPSQAFPALIQNKIDSSSLRYKVVNAGVSGETSSGGRGRIDWIVKQPIDVFVLELGANDGLRGLPVSETKRNLQSIIDRVKAGHPNAKLVLAGMQIPPNMGQQYAREFQSIFPQLAQENNLTLIPFLLQGVGGEAKLNQEDGIHPTAEGAKIVAENVWQQLQKIL